MSITSGQAVAVKAGPRDPDTETSLMGWSGIVIAFHPEDGMVEIEWDSLTLLQLPDAYIRSSIDEGYDYLRYQIEVINVEVIEPRGTLEQTSIVQKDLEAHYWDYELSGKRPLPFSKTEQEGFTTKDSKVFGHAKKRLLAILKTIKGSGSFVASGVSPLVHPGLYVEGVGEIGLPITAGQSRDIISQAKRAPFGKGSQTITDTSVRNVWEIDAQQLSFGNEEWEKFFRKIIEKVKQALGIEESSVTASLYKLLVYETGSFFLPHQDSEKEQGMFGTLVIGLPAKHAGGELIIRFDGREETIDFSSAENHYKLPYTAFYADCEHEVRPVTSGYRVCLVYNLLQSTNTPNIGSPQFSDQIDQMAEVLQQLSDSYEWKPMAVLLDHQYTPANYSLSQLKLHDRPQAEALTGAAEKAGYFASLGLVTLYRSGELEGADFHYEYGRRGRYYDDYEEEEPSGGTMGDIFEEYTTIDHWGESDTPGLGAISILEEDILTEKEMGEGDPIEQQEEGYTGNAGMTIEYWYHYGAVVLWPQSKHLNLLARKPVPVRLQWLEYYIQRWDDEALHSQKYAKQLLISLTEDADPEEKRNNSVDFSSLASCLAKLQDEKLLRQTGEVLLPAVFPNIKVDNWLALIQRYDPADFHSIFRKVTDTDDVFMIRHLVDVLKALDRRDLPALVPFVLHHTRQLPAYLSEVGLHELEVSSFFAFPEDKEKRREAATTIVEQILSLSKHIEQDVEWVQNMLDSLTKTLPRNYANEVLVPVLLSRKYMSRLLAKALYEVCIRDLEGRTAEKPTPPSDWKRETPKTKNYEHLWKLLHPFFSSPTLQVFDYIKNESYRSEMESAIRGTEADLKMETIKKGRPYTLRLIKTQASFERALKDWEEDVVLLKQLRAARVQD